MKIERYSVEGPVKGVTKGYAIWGIGGNGMTPLAYLRKPKWVSDESWEKIVAHIRLTLPAGAEL